MSSSYDSNFEVGLESDDGSVHPLQGIEAGRGDFHCWRGGSMEGKDRADCDWTCDGDGGLSWRQGQHTKSWSKTLDGSGWLLTWGEQENKGGKTKEEASGEEETLLR